MATLALYSFGTQRLVPPEETLARIAPHLERCGITRCTSVTGLDTLGIPTYCSIRPAALALQVSNGKGLTDPAAKVSAAMEALELHHAENPLPWRLRRTCLAELRAEHADVLRPDEIHGFRRVYFGERYICDWVLGEDLASHRPVWAPASAVYFFCTPGLHDTSSNGLASGNHQSEATLHALYELIERDAMSRLLVDGHLRVREYARVVDAATIGDPTIAALVHRMERADTRVLLIALPSAIPLHTFWVVTLNRRPLASVSNVNFGWGTHVDMSIAASRALTEAAQSRLVFIHGAREDILHKQLDHANQPLDTNAYRFFDGLRPSVTWTALEEADTLVPQADLDAQLAQVVRHLTQAGHERLVRFDLSDPEMGIPVVKVIAPSLQFKQKLF